MSYATRESPRQGGWQRWLLLAVLITLSDQAIKFGVAFLMPLNTRLEVTSFFNLVHVLNPGAAFSLLTGAGSWSRYGLTALALGVSVWLMLALRHRLPRNEAVGYCLILGGALGNVLDRIQHGAVIDFLDFHWQGAHWPAFNVADVMITIGAILLITSSFLPKPPKVSSHGGNALR
ncbi:MAG: lipoprotein signal peptidase [Xanthomonadales bacterium]|nr:lipoprotein signal peptidase [Xanthomonadales bacterium]ODU73608.1 MAG: signal peptidase II [Rhodanobacter sp. SCN 69-32]OJY84070.1 MAG: signal peptidase II [Xanthomonadales bacterium 66-474]